MTLVKFLHEKDREGVFAYFPDTIFSIAPNGEPFHTCYADIGQHSACSIEYANECKEATYSEYADLLKELISIGYKDLVIINEQKFELHRQPTKGELKFGVGATHYRDFSASDVVNNKGELKTWILSKDDQLRYYL
jgi:hypothetical protein